MNLDTKEGSTYFKQCNLSEYISRLSKTIRSLQMLESNNTIYMRVNRKGITVAFRYYFEFRDNEDMAQGNL